MSSSPDAPARRARARAGFTLLELLVALVISGILASVLFQLFQGQGRFVSLQSAREEVQQNARGALEILSGELRAVHPAGLLDAQKHSLEFLLPRAWGVVCGPASGGQVVVIFPALSDDALGLRAAGQLLSSAGLQFRYTDGGVVYWKGAPASGWAAPSAGACDIGASGGRAVRFTAAGLPAQLKAGDVAVLYERVRYDVAESSAGGMPGLWIRRSMGKVGERLNQQPLAGPIPAADSLRFGYDVGGATLTRQTSLGGARAEDARVAEAALPSVARIAVYVTTASERAGVDSRQVERDSTILHLRNRP